MNILDRFRLDGKVAIVTGGCGNIGPYWVIALLEMGAVVAVVELKGILPPPVLKKLPLNLSKQLKFYEADIANLNSLSQVHQQIKNDFGSVTILVNNAGIDESPIKNSGKEDVKLRNARFNRMWEINVQGLVNCIEEFSPDMKKAGTGSIINIGSLYMDRSPYEGLYTHLKFDKPWAYGSTKAAVHQITRHFATRLAKYNIRVNTLSPGGVLDKQDKEFIRKFSQRVPLGRMAQKEKDLGGPLIFLASDTSCYVTGINLQVNGGYTAW